MVSIRVELRKRIIFLIGIVFVVVIGFVSVSIYQWSKLANEEYFYDDPRKLSEKLKGLPYDLNIESIKRLKATVNSFKFKFVVMGDSRGNHKILSRVVAEALSHKPDFIIFLGDLTENGKLRHYRKELDFIKKNIHIPFIFVIGNHDYDNNGYISYAHIFGPLDFYFDIGRYRFICIDNNFLEKVEKIIKLPDSDMEWETEAGIDDEKMALLESLLGEESYINLIFMHQPPPLEGWEHHSFSENGVRFLNLIKRNNSKVPYVCASHLHGYDIKELDGVKFVISGGAGARLRMMFDRVTREYNYVLFEVNGMEIKDRVYFIN